MQESLKDWLLLHQLGKHSETNTCGACRPAQQDDPPEDFYDFTAEDLVRITAAKTAGEGPMLTRALRERRAQATAGQYGPVPVRILFPGDIVVQVSFTPGT